MAGDEADACGVSRERPGGRRKEQPRHAGPQGQTGKAAESGGAREVPWKGGAVDRITSAPNGEMERWWWCRCCLAWIAYSASRRRERATGPRRGRRTERAKCGEQREPRECRSVERKSSSMHGERRRSKERWTRRVAKCAAKLRRMEQTCRAAWCPCDVLGSAE